MDFELLGVSLCRIGGAPVKLPPRHAAVLKALADCAPGYVTDRLLRQLKSRPECRPANYTGRQMPGGAAMRSIIIELRETFRDLGCDDAIERIDRATPWAGYRLLIPISMAT